jgi:hypothetical protein
MNGGIELSANTFRVRRDASSGDWSNREPSPQLAPLDVYRAAHAWLRIETLSETPISQSVIGVADGAEKLGFFELPGYSQEDTQATSDRLR